MLEYAKKNSEHLPGEDMIRLDLAIVFHDAIYDTKSKTNEEDSCIFFENMMRDNGIPADLEQMLSERIAAVKNLIMATKRHEYSEELPETTKIIIRADLERLAIPFPAFWNNTIQLMKEYSFVDWKDFKEGRLAFFKDYAPKVAFLGDTAVANINKAYDTLSVWQPKIAVYPGSFDPFHVGHLRILQKATLIFDKVIVAVGKNPAKKTGVTKSKLPSSITQNYQVDYYEGLLTDYLKTKDYPITVVRGLRSGMDLYGEITQYRYLQDLMPEIQLINLFTDRDIEHVSSSGIRSLKDYMERTQYEIF
jgi:pantetheine-phosphate adenylyltransferase